MWYSHLCNCRIQETSLRVKMNALYSKTTIGARMCVTYFYRNFNRSDVGFPPSSINRLTGCMAFLFELWNMRTHPSYDLSDYIHTIHDGDGTRSKSKQEHNQAITYGRKLLKSMGDLGFSWMVPEQSIKESYLSPWTQNTFSTTSFFLIFSTHSFPNSPNPLRHSWPTDTAFILQSEQYNPQQ